MPPSDDRRLALDQLHPGDCLERFRDVEDASIDLVFADPPFNIGYDTWILRPQDVPGGFAADGDTWYFPRVCGTFRERAGWHGCQMPEQLLGRIIRACSNPGDVVLDPFGGSGTTLVVAKKLQRRFLGFELSPEYAAQIQARLDAATPGQPLEGSAEPLATTAAKAPPRKPRRSEAGGMLFS